MKVLCFKNYYHGSRYPSEDLKSDQTSVTKKNWLTKAAGVHNLSSGSTADFLPNKTYLVDPCKKKIRILSDNYTFLVIKEKLSDFIRPHVQSLRNRNILVVFENQEESKYCAIIPSPYPHPFWSRSESRSDDCKLCQTLREFSPPRRVPFHTCNGDDIVHFTEKGNRVDDIIPLIDTKGKFYEILHKAGNLRDGTITTVKKFHSLPYKQYSLIPVSNINDPSYYPRIIAGPLVTSPQETGHKIDPLNSFSQAAQDQPQKDLNRVDETFRNRFLHEKIHDSALTIKKKSEAGDTPSIENCQQSICFRIGVSHLAIEQCKKQINSLLDSQKSCGTRFQKKLEDAATHLTRLERELLDNKKMVEGVMLGEFAIEYPSLFQSILPDHLHQTPKELYEKQKTGKQKLTTLNPSSSNAFRLDQLASLLSDHRYGNQSKSLTKSDNKFISQHSEDLAILQECAIDLQILLEPLLDQDVHSSPIPTPSNPLKRKRPALSA